MEFPIGAWLPDQKRHENPGANEVTNCLPIVDSYKSLNSLSSVSSALPSAALGAFWIKNKAGTIYNFVGTADKLYNFDGISSFTDVSRVAPYSAQRWDFTSFQERVLATDGSSAIQYFDTGTPSIDFADLPGANTINLRCKTLATLTSGFVLAGNFSSDVVGDEPGGFAWSGFNNTELWTPSLSTQSSARRGRGNGGQSQRIVSGSQAVHFRENSVELVTYVGPPVIMDVSDLTTEHGTPAPRSVCATAQLVFYYSPEGFMQLNRNGWAITNIGHGKVNQWFRDNVAPSEIVNMQGFVDRTLRMVWWAFKSSTTSPTYDTVLVYNYADQRFVWLDISFELLGEFVSPGYNLDTIGAVLAADNIDTASINVDDPTYLGGAFQLAAFDSSHRLATFSGAALQAIIETTELRLDPDHRGFTNGVRPYVEGLGATIIEVAPVTRNSLNEPPTIGAFVGVTASTGIADMRVNSRFHRYRLRISGGFEFVQKVSIQSTRRRGRK